MATEEAIRARAKAAILGGLLADHATMGLHWIYKPEQLAEVLAARPGSQEAPEFYEPPACPFYKVPSGEPSPYGYELYALLKYLAEDAQGTPVDQLDGTALAKSLAASYTASTGYLNKSSKYVQAAVAEGKSYPETGHPEDAQANAFVKAPAVVALLAGKPALRSVTEVAVRVQQNNDAAAKAGLAGALLLEKVVLGASAAEAAAWIASPESGIPEETRVLLTAALQSKDAPFTETVAKFGPSCGLPASLQNSVVAAAKFPSFVGGVRANILAGGDNASRSVLIGAVLAAHEGLAGLPDAWKAKTHNYAALEALVDKLLARRG